MTHVTIEDLKSLVFWLISKQNFCIQQAREEFEKGNVEASNELLASAGAHNFSINRIQALIDKENGII